VTSPLRVSAAAEGVLGAALALKPRTATRLARGPCDSVTCWTARLLGVRMVAQGTLTWIKPRRDVALAGSGVDLLHAASMVGAASVSPRHRRVALTSAGIALMLAGSAARAARSAA
jgi:hypothetical protein